MCEGSSESRKSSGVSVLGGKTLDMDWWVWMSGIILLLFWRAGGKDPDGVVVGFAVPENVQCTFVGFISSVREEQEVLQERVLQESSSVNIR